jgi:hypothetical protein
MLKAFAAFIKERHSIYLKRQAGMPKPWTGDKILQSYRFCNVYRELDTVTQWIRKNWRQPNYHEPDVWFMMAIARLVNNPETLKEYSPNGPKKWRSNFFVDALHHQRDAGKKVFSGAYIVSTNGRAMDKAEYLAKHVLDPLWEARKDIRPRKGDTLASFHARLTAFQGLGSFMAAQVVCDTKYTATLDLATDWHTWAAPGPGSKRGLNRVCGDDKDDPWRDDAWLAVLQRLRREIKPILPKEWSELHAQDLQNCLCEFDKYERTRLNEGRPRSTYPGRK